MLRLELRVAAGPVWLLAISLIAGVGGESSVEAAPLRAGVAVENITAKRPDKTVHDPLCVKVLVVDDGSTKAVIICTDLITASEAFVSAVRGRVHRELGIDPSGVLISASHNHHTGGQIVKDLVDRTVKAVGRAAGSMSPVRIGVGSGREDRITMNRRLRLKSGKHWTIRRANPSPQDWEVAGLGPMDPEIGILRLDRLSGQPLAVLYNFAAHAYGGVPNGAVTADFPGFASKVLEEAMGEGTVALFLQGAAGDVTPVLYKDVDAPPPTEGLGTMLGLSTLKAARRVQMKAEATVSVVSENVELPRRTDLARRIQSLETQQEEILQFFTGVGCGTHGAGTMLNFKSFLPLYMKHAVDPVHPAYSSYRYAQEQSRGSDGLEHLDADNKRRVEKYLQAIYTMEKLIRIRSNLKSLQSQQKRAADGPLVTEVQGIKIGDFVLVTFAGEPFAEVALRIKKASPCRFTFLAAYANGSVGYAPTADACDKEAYEDSLSQLAPEWQEIYEKTALAVIRRLQSAEEKGESSR